MTFNINDIKPKTLATAIFLALMFTTEAQAAEMTRDEYKELQLKLIEVETDCWKGKKGSLEKYKELRKKIYSGYSDFPRDFNEFPSFTKCPPGKKRVMYPKKEQRYAHSGGDYSALSYASIAFFYLPLTRVDPPQTGYGTNITRGESFVGLTDRSVTGFSLGGEVTAKGGKWSLGFGYTDVDGSSEAQVAPGGDVLGIVFNDFADSGSTGLNLGASGMDVRTETDYQAFSGKITWTPGTVGTIKVWKGKINFGAGVRVENTEHTAEVTTPTFSDIRSDSVQKINEKVFYLVGHSTFDLISQDNNSDIGLSITPKLEAGYRTASLDSTQRNICGLCGAADQDFTINIEDKTKAAPHISPSEN